MTATKKKTHRLGNLYIIPARFHPIRMKLTRTMVTAMAMALDDRAKFGAAKVAHIG